MKKPSNPTLILVLFVILNLVIGLFIAEDFGRSTDETSEFNRAGVAVDIFLGDLLYDLEPAYEDLGHVRFYGTAATSLIHIVERVIFPNTDHGTKVVAHYLYFVYFQLAVIGLYLLGNHFYDQWISLAVAVLFGTQPLLFGHGFINPKDIPLLAVFLFAVVAGFKMVDLWIEQGQLPASTDVDQRKRAVRFWVALILILLVLWSRTIVLDLVLDLVEYAYTTQETSQIGRMFASLTTSGSLEGYFGLAESYISQIYLWLTLLSPVLLLVVYRYARRYKLFGGEINYWVFLAAAVWGFAVSTRVISAAAGGIVGIYALVKLRQRAIVPLAIYTLSASVFSYVTWPFLWVVGFRGYFASLGNISAFPWKGNVLFEGQVYAPEELPARYLPKLMAIQFTEPAVILVVIGLLVGVYLIYKKAGDPVKLALLYAWFFLPMLYVIISKPIVYTNFRHFLFTIPPIFIFAGLAIKQIMDRVRRPVLNLLLMVLVLLPGLIAIVQYHPYEYIYYNSFTGGTDGAYQSYEMDYWRLSYKGAMGYVNKHVPKSSKIVVWKNNRNGEIYATKWLLFEAHVELTEEEMLGFDYAIVPADQLERLPALQDAEVLHATMFRNVPLMLVLEIPDQEGSP